MLGRQALTLAVLAGADVMSPAAAQSSTSFMMIVAPADTAWPAIVPRLTSYTPAQKTAITDLIQQYCAEHRVARRPELQAKIQRLLTPEQVVEAIRYWLPQNVRYDFRELGRERQGQPEALDACDRPERLG